jgi:hypothetical protein
MGKLSTEDRKEIPATKYAFPKEKKEPLENAAHVRNAIARFNQVEGVSEAEKDAAWKRIRAAAKKFGVEMEEGSRKELKPKPAKKTAAKKTAAKKTPATKTAAKTAAKTTAKKTAAKKKAS